VRRTLAALALAAMTAAPAWPQTPQNPSPMVEHTRAHPRLQEQHPAGRREKLDLGTLYLPATHPRAILFFFHGGTWLPEVAAARHKIAVVSVQAGSGSGTYSRLFDDPQRWPRLLADAEAKAGAPFRRVLLGGWSAGCGGVRQILRSPDSYTRVAGVVCIDGIHTDYVDGRPGPLESKIGAENLVIWEQVARDAVAGRKRVLITHSEIFPGTFASTTETADYLIARLAVPRRAVLKWGPMGLQQLGETRSGDFLLMGFAGNSAPDHVDQLHALSSWVDWLLKK
jgi:hypothetical protein